MASKTDSGDSKGGGGGGGSGGEPGGPLVKRPRDDSGKSTAPTNPLVCSMLTDLYQITMAYAYWKSDKHEDKAVFELMFRKNPFRGEYTIFGGLEECLKFVQNFGFTDTDIEFLKTKFPRCTDPAFFVYLRQLTARGVTIRAIDEGSVVFPRVPLLCVEGPLAVVQMLETTLLTLVNYASLVATNAARCRIAAGDTALVVEAGLRRAQGPDGGLSASRYCFMGGCVATTNVQAGMLFDIPVHGSFAHSFVASFGEDSTPSGRSLISIDGHTVCNDFFALVTRYREKMQEMLGAKMQSHPGELAAFTAFALALPNSFMALIDTYDTLRSGAPNFCCVALALGDLGYIAKGIRLDSGDLSFLSLECKAMFKKIATHFQQPKIETVHVMASNDIDEATILSMKTQGHSIDVFMIGTNLVTCQATTALGGVYKLVELNGRSCMKISGDLRKVTIPGRKNCYRLFGKEGAPICDLMQTTAETAPTPASKVLARHPFDESKRASVSITAMEPLLHLYLSELTVRRPLPRLEALRDRVIEQLRVMRKDHLRDLNPTPYKVSVTDKLYDHMHKLWLDNAPVGELV